MPKCCRDIRVTNHSIHYSSKHGYLFLPQDNLIDTTALKPQILVRVPWDLPFVLRNHCEHKDYVRLVHQHYFNACVLGSWCMLNQNVLNGHLNWLTSKFLKAADAFILNWILVAPVKS